MALFLLHALHLRADFPNYSPWMDYAKYTDEGWYGNAAIEAFIRGSWYVPGDFNTAVALPVWPFLEWVLFHFTGVSVVAARALVVAVFGGNLLLTYGVVSASGRRSWELFGGGAGVREPESGRASERWPALLATTLVAASGFLFCFSRLAILEPLVVFCLLLCWLLALGRGPGQAHNNMNTAGSPADASFLSSRDTLRLIAIGIVSCIMVLTKTTAVVLLPSVLYLVWRTTPRHQQLDPGKMKLSSAIRDSSIVAGAGLLPWAAYYLLLVRPRYLADYKYLFSANIYQQPTTPYGWLMAFWYAIHGGLWIDRILFVAAAALLVVCLFFLKPPQSKAAVAEPHLNPKPFTPSQNPLFIGALVAVILQIAFIGYHNNMQPRYYTVIAYPLFILIALSAQSLMRQNRNLGRAAIAVISIATLWNVHQTIGYALHPQYTFVSAASNLTRYIDQHPNGNRLLLSISGNEIGLVTGLPAICDDFGTLSLPLRIHQYQPGWYAAWNELDPGSLQDIHTQFLVEQVAKFPAFDDRDRNVLILYKLHPLPAAQQKLADDGPDADENKPVYPDFGGDKQD